MTEPDATTNDSNAVPLTSPREGLPALTVDSVGLVAVAEALANGCGAVAVDTERASGYRYGQSAYLLQFRRAGSGTSLVDPVDIHDFTPLQAAIGGAEWIIHSALQDLGCLHDLGLSPAYLFDTEHAAKLLGKPRFGLSALVESELGFSLAKEHSAADWSTRPLPPEWLNYAALDVELLVELRDTLAEQLDAAGRWEWAQQEFAHLNAWRAPAPDAEPWRRTSGIHRATKPSQLAVVRALWQARDLMAQEKDKAPGRLLPDAGIVDIARLPQPTVSAIKALPTLRNRGHKALAEHWSRVVEEALALPPAMRPGPNPKSNGYPPPKAWADRFPEAAQRWGAIRPALNEQAESLGIPPEVLVSPEAIRRLCWEPGDALVDEQQLGTWLSAQGARQWQCELVVPTILAAAAQQ